MKKIVFVFVCFLSFIKIAHADTSVESVSFVRCVDGDTAVFLLNEEEVKFRFLAIDTPETVHPNIDVEAYGKDASELTCNLLTNAIEILVEYENSNKVDKYGRNLAWIWVDGILLQEQIVKIGYGEVAYIYGNYRYTESLCLAQKEAKDSSIGIWAGKHEEGYCSTIDLTDVTNNIIYSEIDNKKPTIENEPNEEEKELLDSYEKIDDFVTKLSNYLEANDAQIQNIFTYIFLAAAFIVFVIKEFKK